MAQQPVSVPRTLGKTESTFVDIDSLRAIRERMPPLPPLPSPSAGARAGRAAAQLPPPAALTPASTAPRRESSGGWRTEAVRSSMELSSPPPPPEPVAAALTATELRHSIASLQQQIGTPRLSPPVDPAVAAPQSPPRLVGSGQRQPSGLVGSAAPSPVRATWSSSPARSTGGSTIHSVPFDESRSYAGSSHAGSAASFGLQQPAFLPRRRSYARPAPARIERFSSHSFSPHSSHLRTSAAAAAAAAGSGYSHSQRSPLRSPPGGGSRGRLSSRDMNRAEVSHVISSRVERARAELDSYLSPRSGGGGATGAASSAGGLSSQFSAGAGGAGAGGGGGGGGGGGDASSLSYSMAAEVNHTLTSLQDDLDGFITAQTDKIRLLAESIEQKYTAPPPPPEPEIASTSTMRSFVPRAAFSPPRSRYETYLTNDVTMRHQLKELRHVLRESHEVAQESTDLSSMTRDMLREIRGSSAPRASPGARSFAASFSSTVRGGGSVLRAEQAAAVVAGIAEPASRLGAAADGSGRPAAGAAERALLFGRSAILGSEGYLSARSTTPTAMDQLRGMSLSRSFGTDW